ncbi:hypothetical protein B296_00025047 [Ensete ventricosum]|uniref:Uncharacterized protein n=1 Tax=Ensete ventricosum TaxID=4639 RepID=A0A426ZXU7_ENSVE|nr:hypothetical protein B296_00025047 [Ensete ventricosum]
MNHGLSLLFTRPTKSNQKLKMGDLKKLPFGRQNVHTKAIDSRERQPFEGKSEQKLKDERYVRIKNGDIRRKLVYERRTSNYNMSYSNFIKQIKCIVLLQVGAWEPCPAKYLMCDPSRVNRRGRIRFREDSKRSRERKHMERTGDSVTASGTYGLVLLFSFGVQGEEG